MAITDPVVVTSRLLVKDQSGTLGVHSQEDCTDMTSISAQGSRIVFAAVIGERNVLMTVDVDNTVDIIVLDSGTEIHRWRTP